MLPAFIAATNRPEGDQTSTYSVLDTRDYIVSLGKEPTDEEVMFFIDSWAFEDFDGGPYTLTDLKTGEAL